MNVNYTHQKVPYKAVCLKASDDTAHQIIKLLNQRGAECDLSRPNYIMVKWPSARSNTTEYALKHGYWVVQGENGFIKFYDEDRFSEKYQPLQ